MENQNINNDFYSEIFDYVSEVFVGIETKLFKSCEEKKDLKEKLTNSDGMAIGSNTLECYLNQVYRGLVDKNDEFVLQQFQKFQNHSKISSVFLLNIISVSMMNVFQKMNRTKLNSSGDLDTYIKSVRENIQIMKKYYLFSFNKEYIKYKEAEHINKYDA